MGLLVFFGELIVWVLFDVVFILFWCLECVFVAVDVCDRGILDLRELDKVLDLLDWVVVFFSVRWILLICKFILLDVMLLRL